MSKNYIKKLKGKKFNIVVMSLIYSVQTFCTKNDTMVWESKVSDVSSSIAGPTAMAIGIAMLVISALGMLFGGGAHSKTMLTVIIALAIVGGAATLAGWLIPSSGMIF